MGRNPSTSPRGKNFQSRERDKKSITDRQAKICNNRRWKTLLSNKSGQFKMKLYQPIRSKFKTKDRKRLFNSPTKMDKKFKRKNIQLQRTYSNPLSLFSFPPNSPERKFQIYSNQNRQLSRDVQHQQESRCSQSISSNQKDMVVNGQTSNVQ
jgi:hypothetical protein